jgi:hypothetical protein
MHALVNIHRMVNSLDDGKPPVFSLDTRSLASPSQGGFGFHKDCKLPPYSSLKQHPGRLRPGNFRLVRIITSSRKRSRDVFRVRKNREQYGTRTPPRSRRVSGQLDDGNYESITEANDPALVFNMQQEISSRHPWSSEIASIGRKMGDAVLLPHTVPSHLIPRYLNFTVTSTGPFGSRSM